jgi:hypothetical protein
MASVAVFIADARQSKESFNYVALREQADKASMLDEIVGTSAGLRRT